MITFGIRLPVAGPLAGREAMTRTAIAADDLGYESVWSHDFLIWNRYLDVKHVSCGSVEAVEKHQAPPTFHESITNLTYLAGVTAGRKIKLGFAVLCLPFRNPIILGRQLANLDALSEGRLVLGVGVGAPKDVGNEDFEVLGIPREGRYERMDEYAHAMQAMWTQDVSSFDGTYVKLPPQEFFPKPVQKPHPPMWVGGFGPKALQQVADYGDGWLPGLAVQPKDYAGKVEQIIALKEKAGRGAYLHGRGTEITGVAIAPTQEQALATARRTLDSVVEGYGGGSHGSLTFDNLLERTLVGSPEEIIRKAEAYVKGGVNHFELKFIYHSVDHLLEQMDQFSREVMPKFSTGMSAPSH
jgi:alkanesulfonate monooxygenase SsuD/methylene tetrahydromethanopterin reductase-like flavin-dependent oxidoreductase (luciferase family)